MVVLTAKASKGKIAVILLILLSIAALLIVLCTHAEKGAAESTAVRAATNNERVAYLESFGWELDPKPAETQEVRIPQELPEVLQKYNTLQQSQGFDLTDYSGKTVKRYVYQVTNYPDTADSYFATLLVYDGAVIGGDVSSAAQSGIMQGFAYPGGTTGQSETQSQTGQTGTSSRSAQPTA